MSTLSDAIVLERRVAAPGARSRNRQQRLNDVLAVALIGIVALAPIPLGSNRPFFWALWAAVLGVIAAIYLGILIAGGEKLRFGLGRLWLPLGLTLALLGFLAVQMLPLDPHGYTFVTASGERVVGSMMSLMPGATWLTMLLIASYALFFFLMLQVAVNRARARTLGVVLLVVITAHATYGLVALTMLGDPLLVFDKWAHAGFATGTFVNRNSFATFLAMGLVLGVTLTLREALGSDNPATVLRPGVAIVHLACTAMILAALLATGSRMGLLAGLTGGALAVIMVLGKRPVGGRLRSMLIGGLPIAGAIAMLWLYGAETIERLGSLETDANVRGALYAQVLAMIAARPWLGYGGGAFEVAYPLFHMLPVSPDLVWDKAHSTYLTLWAELGVVAGSLPLLIFAGFAAWAFRLCLGRQADWAASAMAVAAILVCALHSSVDFSLEIEANMLLLLAIVALGLGRGAKVETDGAR